LGRGKTRKGEEGIETGSQTEPAKATREREGGKKKKREKMEMDDSNKRDSWPLSSASSRKSRCGASPPRMWRCS